MLTHLRIKIAYFTLLSVLKHKNQNRLVRSFLKSVIKKYPAHVTYEIFKIFLELEVNPKMTHIILTSLNYTEKNKIPFTARTYAKLIRRTLQVYLELYSSSSYTSVGSRALRKGILFTFNRSSHLV
jgi:hypothetical protein